jgi:hypothetical protein
MVAKAKPTMFWLYEKERTAIDAQAKKEGRSWGAIVRDLIDVHLLKLKPN